MLIDLYRLIRIILKFLLYDFWVGLLRILFGKQNPKIQAAYSKRVGTRRKKA